MKPDQNPVQSMPRRIACARCGTDFACDPGGRCWCMDETVRLPVPIDGRDCLCRDCLRALAAAGSAA